MKNPLLVPELRELLATDNIDVLQNFCESNPPSEVADFLGALSSKEIWEILVHVSPETRSLIFSSLDEDVKFALLDVLEHHELVNVLSNMPEAKRLHFTRQIPDKIIQKLHSSLVSPTPELAPSECLATVANHIPLEKIIIPEDLEGMTIFKSENGKIHRISKFEKNCWLNVVNPKQEELNFLSEKFHIASDFLTASLDIDERARIEIEDNITLVVLKIPFFDETNLDVLYITLPVGVIILQDMIITVCARDTEILGDFIKNRVKHFYELDRNKFILQIFLRTVLLYLKYLKQINNATNIIQKKVEQASKNQQLIKLLNIEKSLVYFTTSLKSNQLMLERLQKLGVLVKDEEVENLVEDITTESKQAIEMANVYSDILSGMMDAFASIISNNLNYIMKILTLITITLTVPVLITSFFGMNVRLPFMGHTHAFLIIIGVSLLLSIAEIIFFVRKKWI